MLNEYIVASAIGALLFMIDCTKNSQKNEYKVSENKKITNNNIIDEEKMAGK